MQDSFNLQ